MKLKKVVFDEHGFRNLKKLVLDIAPRITVIAGHNGIGKSTILGLISNCSEYTDNKTVLGKAFRADFSELFFLDYYKDLKDLEPKNYSAYLHYDIEGTEIIKKCQVTGTHKQLINKNQFQKFLVKVSEDQLTEKQKSTLTDEKCYVYRMRIIPRLDNKVPSEITEKYKIGGAAKIEIPTLYLGMSRMSPIGEFEWGQVNQKEVKSLTDLNLIYTIFNEIIPIPFFQASEKKGYIHSFKQTNKQSIVPDFNYPSLSISLGQDSLSSIITAIASFNELKKTINDQYIGGILVIDEVESGLHPKAQMALIKQLKKYATILNLQIVLTTHSLTIIKEVLERNPSQDDTVIYLKDTFSPKDMKDVTYTKIKNDMLLEPFKPQSEEDITEIIPDLFCYFEDEEASDFMKGILSALGINDTFSKFGKKLEIVSAKLGCTTLNKLSDQSPHFRSSLIFLDADTQSDDKTPDSKNSLLLKENVIQLPIDDDSSIYNQLPPDKIAYLYLYLKFKNINENYEFWHEKTPEFFSSNYYLTYLQDISKHYGGNLTPVTSIEDIKNISRKAMKKWYEANQIVLNEIQIFKLWAQEHHTHCDRFIKILVDKVDSMRTKS
ncbi:AAA family ATPase [Acinetobacter bereziniae]|uniref:AAA family ATPase n=1 Tax=Acinetobacter bereziniae TaxID=106648 RepID=UPI00124CD44D|nr:AAA family ATPase [Acinetobacter bereziniae]